MVLSVRKPSVHEHAMKIVLGSSVPCYACPLHLEPGHASAVKWRDLDLLAISRRSKRIGPRLKIVRPILELLAGGGGDGHCCVGDEKAPLHATHDDALEQAGFVCFNRLCFRGLRTVNALATGQRLCTNGRLAVGAL